MDTCLYHGDKPTFDEVQKQLRIAKLLPREYAHRLAMAVCSCRKVKGTVAASGHLELQADYLHDLLQSDTESQLPRPIRKLITDCITHIRQGNLEPSACRLVTILYNAIKFKDFTLLKRENVSSNKLDIGPRAMKKPVKGKQRLTPAQIELIKKKRKKKLVSQMVTLSMFPGNKKSMERKLRDTIFDFSKKNNCYIDFVANLNNQSFENNLKTTHVEIWCKDYSSLGTVKFTLSQAAEAAQKEMDAQRAKYRARKVNRRQRQEDENDATSGPYAWEDNLDTPKDWLADDYEKKYFKEKNRGSSKKSSNPVLEGGHCLQCLKPYTGLGDTSSCTYHSGFQDADGIWSCCSECYEHLYPAVDFDLHSETGCTTSENHVWRPHAKRCRPGSKKEFYTKNQFARTRHVKHRYPRHNKK